MIKIFRTVLEFLIVASIVWVLYLHQSQIGRLINLNRLSLEQTIKTKEILLNVLERQQILEDKGLFEDKDSDKVWMEVS